MMTLTIGGRVLTPGASLSEPDEAVRRLTKSASNLSPQKISRGNADQWWAETGSAVSGIPARAIKWRAWLSIEVSSEFPTTKSAYQSRTPRLNANQDFGVISANGECAWPTRTRKMVAERIGASLSLMAGLR
jgi:hypothetical protein